MRDDDDYYYYFYSCHESAFLSHVYIKVNRLFTPVVNLITVSRGEISTRAKFLHHLIRPKRELFAKLIKSFS